MPRLPALDSTALFLDLDGTLVPLAPRPEHVNLPDSTLHLLQGLQGACSGALALVSGRDKNSLLPLIRDTPIALISSHGACMHDASGEPRWEAELDPGGYARLHDSLTRLIQPYPRVWIEQKSHGLAVHFRQDPQAEALLTDRLDALALAHLDLPLTRGHCVAEFRVDGFNKGEGLARAQCQAPFKGRTPVMIGDDLTDEDAFDYVNEQGGISIRIGQPLPASAARFLLPDPFSLLGLLHAWLTTPDEAPPLEDLAHVQAI